MRRDGLGTIQNVKGRQRETPYGKSTLGDAIWFARTVGNFGSQEALGALAGIKRVEVLKLENGDNKGNSRHVMAAIGRALGRPYDDFEAYIRGDYGPPSEDAARRFLAGEPRREPAAPTKPMHALVAQALVNLSRKVPLERFPTLRGIAEGLAFLGAESASIEEIEQTLLTLEAGARGKAAGIQVVGRDDAPTGPGNLKAKRGKGREK